MKKIGILSILAVSLLGLASCDSAGDAAKAKADSLAAAATNATPVVADPNTPPVPTEPVIDLPVTTVTFTNGETHDFKEIKEGEKVVHEFKFKNTGTNPVKVYNVKPSCGCTTPDWTKEPVPPGGEGFIKVEFDSKGKSGLQKKSVTVTMNTEPKTKVLNFQGEVMGGPGADAGAH